ncbi:hypothetical protein B0A50_01086 [Salinomyces thailandicus]|uniref:Uncharacterized protein n=1 Tax=Salinomyces thailandicus TaxID=706561 RepID=A0A4U0UBN8_9PEZI|nr:hypothetical protein B0A50_01086 [Salinomyces thailandica]
MAPLDPELLSSKLEFHRRQQAEKLIRDDPTKHTGYVPKYAARQFAATTSNQANADESKSAVRRAKTVKERPKPGFGTESTPSTTVNPKRMQAGRSVGMTDHEVVAAAAADSTAARPDASRSNSASSIEEQQKKKGSAGLKAKRSVRVQRPHPSREVLSSDNNMQAYHPGDAAKRKAEKRLSSNLSPPPPQPPAGRPFGYIAEYSLDFATLQAEAGNRAQHSALEDSNSTESHHHPVRPVTLMKPHDRHNWAQQSQAGEDMRHLLHPRRGRRKSTTTAEDRGEALKALEEGAPPTTQENLGTGQQGSTLISDAVSQINKEKKSRRRQTVAAFFRRL